MQAMEEIEAVPVGAEAAPEAAALAGATKLPTSCPMTGLLERLTRPWTLHLLWLFHRHGAMRFGVLRRRAEGISARVLAVRLRTLESEGFVTRTVRGNKMPEVTYTPTARLRDMHEFMGQLHRLGAKWQSEETQSE